MDPQAFTLSVLGLIAVIFGAAIWIFYIGRGHLRAEVDALRAEVERAVARAEIAERDSDARLLGDRGDLLRHGDRARANYNFDRVLNATYGVEADTAPGESGDEDHQEGAGTNAT